MIESCIADVWSELQQDILYRFKIPESEVVECVNQGRVVQKPYVGAS